MAACFKLLRRIQVAEPARIFSLEIHVTATPARLAAAASVTFNSGPPPSAAPQPPPQHSRRERRHQKRLHRPSTRAIGSNRPLSTHSRAAITRPSRPPGTKGTSTARKRFHSKRDCANAASIPPSGPHPVSASGTTRPTVAAPRLAPATAHLAHTPPSVRTAVPPAPPLQLQQRLVPPIRELRPPASTYPPISTARHPSQPQPAHDRLDPPMKVRQVELLIRRMQIVVRQPKPHHHRRNPQLPHKIPHNRNRPAAPHKYRLLAPNTACIASVAALTYSLSVLTTIGSPE